METIKERITKFLGAYGISVREFEKKCGLANGYMARLRMSPSVDKADNILSAYPMLSREWLLFSEGEMLKQVPSNVQIGDGNMNQQGNTTTTTSKTTNNYNSGCEQSEKANGEIITRMLETLSEQSKKHLELLDKALSIDRDLEEIKSMIKQVLDRIN